MTPGETLWTALRRLVAQIPPGRVTTLGALAEALGDGRAAPAVLRMLRDRKPRGYHRVVRSDGSLPFPEVRRKLEAEGVPVEAMTVRDPRQRTRAGTLASPPLRALRERQEELARRLVLEDRFDSLETVAGVDVAYRRGTAYAATVVLDRDSGEERERATVRTEASFPYIPTYLAFRELPPIARCLERLREPPSLLLVDANGTLHPTGFGLACHVGVELEFPTVGVAKRLLLGTVNGDLAGAGTSAPVRWEGRAVGVAFRPRADGRPIYVSPGHRVSPATALELVRPLCRAGVPEPLRRADRVARAARGAGDA